MGYRAATSLMFALVGAPMAFTPSFALTPPTTGAVATRYGHVLVLKSDGTVWGWGSNDRGQLGTGVCTALHSTPVAATGLTGVAAIACGQDYSLALMADGTVRSWGWNHFGQLGDGSTTIRSTPVGVTGLSRVVAIAAGKWHCGAITDTGQFWGWGHNSYGQLGDGGYDDRILPVRAGITALSSGSGIVALAMGEYHSLALKSNGKVLAWGNNSCGQLGDGTTEHQQYPYWDVYGLQAVVAIAAGDNHCIALTADGSVWTWGRNTFGQLGNGSTTSSSYAARVGGLSSIVAIAAGHEHSMALKSDGTVWTWGALGVAGLPVIQTTPVLVPGVSAAIQIAAGECNTALRSDGTLQVWGANQAVPLGDGFRGFKSVPVQMANLPQVSQLAAGGSKSFVVARAGEVWKWGGREAPNLLGIDGVVVVASGREHTLALRTDGSVWAWGENSCGRLGDGTVTNSVAPVPVVNFTGGAGIAAGGMHSVATKTDGTVWCWGLNDDGQLGDGTRLERRTAVQVTGISGVVAVAAGYMHTVALRADGTVWGWGKDSWGQLGVGHTYSSSSVPVRARNLSGVVAIATGDDHNLALKNDGTVWSWGINSDGALGYAGANYATEPVRVPGLTGISAIAAGAKHSLAIGSDGTVWAWGTNRNGELGDGSGTPYQTSPVRIPALFGAQGIVGGRGHTLALDSDGFVWACGLNDQFQLGHDSTGPVRCAIRLTPATDDTDQDAMSDLWELQRFGDLSHSGGADGDGDGLTDIQEFAKGTDPVTADPDCDLLTDFADAYPNDSYNGETPALLTIGGDRQTTPAGLFNALPFDVIVRNAAATKLLPHAPVFFSFVSGGGALALSNTGNPLLVETLVANADEDGSVRVYHKQPNMPYVLSHIRARVGVDEAVFESHSTISGDRDGDGMLDAWESALFGFGGCAADDDPDGDGLSNLGEFMRGTNPFLADTDGDSISDKDEIDGLRDPLTPGDGMQRPNGYRIVIRMPNNEYRGVTSDWRIVPMDVPSPTTL